MKSNKILGFKPGIKVLKLCFGQRPVPRLFGNPKGLTGPRGSPKAKKKFLPF